MKIRHAFSLGCLLVSAAVASANGIVGTYRLVSRQFPDGTKVPAVGLANFTATTYNFNVQEASKSGKKATISFFGEYRLADNQWEETRLFTLRTEDGVAKLLDATPRTGKAAVKISGGRIEFQPPDVGHGLGPSFAFDEKGLVATMNGVFVDTWARVKE